MIKGSIFVSIAACEERFIEQTIKSALINADNPKNIYFGVFNNILKQEHSLLNNEFLTENDQIFYAELMTPAPMGTGFARMNASLLQFKDFEYMFQIDAHTFFPKKWDTTIINIFNKIKNDNDIDENKIILSATTGFIWTYYEDDLKKIYAIENNKNLFEINPFDLEKNAKSLIDRGMVGIDFVYDGMQGNTFIEDNLNFPIVYGNMYIDKKEYKESQCVHAAFMFSKATLVRDVMHDPEDYFHGDQTNYSIRLLSRGYKIFSPKYPTIATLNKVFVDKESGQSNEEHLDKEHNWRTYIGNQVGGDYVTKKKISSKSNFNKIISGKYFGYWGATDKHSLDKIKKQINYPIGNKQ